MKLPSPIARHRARIEIVPLIDVMFFLLAAFMVASLRLDRTRNIRLDLPPARQAQAGFDPAMVQLAVDRSGAVWLERKRIPIPELAAALTNRPGLRRDSAIYIGGDRATRHADMAAVYAAVRGAGFQHVALLAEPPSAGAPP